MDVWSQRSKQECSWLSVHIDAIRPGMFSRSMRSTVGAGESRRADGTREIACLHPSQWSWNPMSHQPKNQLTELNSRPESRAFLKGKVGRCPHGIRLGNDFLASTPTKQTKDQSRTRKARSTDSFFTIRDIASGVEKAANRPGARFASGGSDMVNSQSIWGFLLLSGKKTTCFWKGWRLELAFLLVDVYS